MSHIRTLRYGVPGRSRGPRTQEIEIGLLRGLHSGLPEYRLPNGFTPDASNFLPSYSEHGIQPRSGLSYFLERIDWYPDAVELLFDPTGAPALAALSSGTVWYKPYANPIWSELSRLGERFSHVTTQHVEIIQANSAATSWGIIVNGVNPPKIFNVEQDTVTWSDFSKIYSIASTAATGTQSDERLVLANLQSAQHDYPRRLMWSTRGTPTDFTIALGAGFADLTEMDGAIVRIIPDVQGFVILGSNEIWRACPRRDVYAFDFIPITRNIGCSFPRTAAETPFGTVFLGNDYEPYTLSGSQLRPLGVSEDSAGHSRVRRYIQQRATDANFVWGLYDYIKQRYTLHLDQYTALTYDFQTDSWWPIEYRQSVWRGTMVIDPPALKALGLSWNNQPLAWDSSDARWDEEGLIRQPFEESYPLYVSGIGSVYADDDKNNTDAGLTYSAYWRSPRISVNARRYQYDGSWIEYTGGAGSSYATISHIFDSHTDERVYSLRSSNLSTVWAPAHGGGRATSVKMTVPGGTRQQFTSLYASVKIYSGFGGGR